MVGNSKVEDKKGETDAKKGLKNKNLGLDILFVLEK